VGRKNTGPSRNGTVEEFSSATRGIQMPIDRYSAHKVLIVDDEAIPRDLESIALEGTGRYLAIETGNASDALNQLADGSYDCAVIDLDMPDMSGLELITMIRRSQANAQLPIVLVLPDDSGLSSDSTETLGATRVITKPFNPWDLARLLDGLLDNLDESPHVLSVEAVLRGFPYSTMILDAEHHVVLANEVFYELTSTGVDGHHVVCNDELHTGGAIPDACPLDEAVRTGQAATHDIETVLGKMRVSVYPLAAFTGANKPLFLHVTQPAE